MEEPTSVGSGIDMTIVDVIKRRGCKRGSGDASLFKIGFVSPIERAVVGIVRKDDITKDNKPSFKGDNAIVGNKKNVIEEILFLFPQTVEIVPQSMGPLPLNDTAGAMTRIEEPPAIYLCLGKFSVARQGNRNQWHCRG